jgi:hypothetical protein
MLLLMDCRFDRVLQRRTSTFTKPGMTSSAASPLLVTRASQVTKSPRLYYGKMGVRYLIGTSLGNGIEGAQSITAIGSRTDIYLVCLGSWNT